MASKFFFAAIAGLALAQVFECPEDWELHEYNTYPVENDPTSFYVCGHQGAVIHTCPPNTSFNSALYYCDWIALPSHAARKIRAAEVYNEAEAIPLPCPQVECPVDWQERPYNAYSDPTSCNNFCVCGHHGAILQTCPEGLLFSDILHYCDWESSVVCNVQ